jgi:hypothetical protein
MREGVSADRLRYKFFGPTEDFLGPQAELSVAATFEEAPATSMSPYRQHLFRKVVNPRE